jgi:hypothetical protein
MCFRFFGQILFISTIIRNTTGSRPIRMGAGWWITSKMDAKCGPINNSYKKKLYILDIST